jgi:hypothetical protein
MFRIDAAAEGELGLLVARFEKLRAQFDRKLAHFIARQECLIDLGLGGLSRVGGFLWGIVTMTCLNGDASGRLERHLQRMNEAFTFRF